MVHIVTYDLKSPHDSPDDYKRVIDGLKSLYTSWCHLEESVWLVETSLSAAEVRDTIKIYLSASDVLFVARLSGNWGSFNLTPKRSDWLKGREF